jgi:two-component system sensor histidine kinase KdpD
MDRLRSLRPSDLVRPTAVIVASLTVVTLIVGLLERAGIDDASTLYLLAVVLTGVVAGAGPAVVAAVGAFVAYDVLFVAPLYTLTVDDPQEWLTLLLLLVVGIVVGRLSGRERDRAEAALGREREANAMFRTSFALATAPSAAAALPGIVADLTTAVRCRRAWIEVADRVVADSAEGVIPSGPVRMVLARRPGDQPAEWVRVHDPTTPPNVGSPVVREGATATRFRIAMTAGDRTLGHVWIERARADGVPTAGETRVLAAVADQVARALERDRLADDAAAAEVARRSDVLKSALLDSVSHDLRTPLASIRAAAGTLMDPEIEASIDERRATAAAIDAEAERLNRLVSNLLDLSRIEAGALRPTTSAFVLADLVEAAIGRSAAGRRQIPVELELPADLPPIEVDDVLFDQVLANLLDNADRYAGPAATIRVSAWLVGDEVAMTVEDGGPGVPDEALGRLFDKFYRAPRSGEGARRGTGTGLAVVRGLLEAMGGTATARGSELGGLAIDLAIPAAGQPSHRVAIGSAVGP